MPLLPQGYINSAQLPTIKTRQRGSPINYFYLPELMAAKKWARDKFDLLRADGLSKEEAATQAVAAVHKMLPGFRKAWEERNKCQFDDEWFKGRIDHQSDKMDEKASHLSLRDFLASTQFEDVQFTWEQWTMMVKENTAKVKVLKDSYVYILPMRKPDSTEYTIQKVGFTTDIEWRLTHYHTCARINGGILGGQKRHCFGLVPASRWAFTHNLGKLQNYQAKSIESQCHVAVGRGEPAAHGSEWFEITTEEAIERVKSVVDSLGVQQ